MKALKGFPSVLCLALLLLCAAGCASTSREAERTAAKSDVAAILHKTDRATPAVMAQLDAQLEWILERRVQRDESPAQD